MLDFDQMHGVWVTRTTFPGSYGRIAFREGPEHFWIRWEDPGYRTKVTEPASREHVGDLKILKVQPEPWFIKCSHCGEYGLPLGYSSESLEDLFAVEGFGEVEVTRHAQLHG